ncbi:MAG: hypothetical protein V7606_3845 [Burkholderiales bacterium]|jgi:hypothetical protein
MKSLALHCLLPALLSVGSAAMAQQLDARFSCSQARSENGEKVTYADNGEMRLKGNRIDTFRWESALFRSTHGFDCSIDESDGLKAEVRDDTDKDMWRVALSDARAARDRRGFNFDRGMNCTIRIEHEGDMLNVKPSCPALCGSRSNFSQLSVNLKTGKCHYEE